jgi:serine/threonine protein kinase
LFDQASDLPESDWAPFLLRECLDDPNLREEVLRILHGRHRAMAEGFLDWPEEAQLAGGPQHIGKYQVVRRLSTQNTGQAVAYLALDPDTQRQVVIKRYHDGGDLQATSEEARALVRVSSPYVARCYGVERVGHNEACLVVEYVPGRSLAEVRAEGPLYPRRAAHIVAQLAEGIAAVHACGLIHRDIKPANVILHDDGTPRLVDFGLAAHLGGSRLQGLSGSPPYMAPEQAKREWDRIDFRTDVYGLGGVLYELLTCHAPHEGENRSELLAKAREGQITAPRTWNHKIPRWLEAVCLKALAPAPERRFASADDFRNALKRYARRHRREAAITIATALVIASLTLAIFNPWSGHSGLPTDHARSGASPAVREDIRVVDFEIMHYPKADEKSYRADLVGRIGAGSFGARFDDGVKVRGELSQPAYSYLLAFAPDGSIVPCAPRDEAARPQQTREAGLPVDAQGDTYYLTEGTGLQAFALVVSREPLPPFAELVRKHGRPPWPAGPVSGTPGIVWSHDGQWLRTRDRDDTTGTRAVGKSRKATGGGSHVEDLARWLRALPDIDAVAVEAFTVEPAAP